MKVRLTDIHNSHGSVFGLSLEVENDQDKEIVKFLREQKKILGKDSVFYVFSLEPGNGVCYIGLSESGIRLAKVDHIWNSSRDDQKFPVIILEDRIDEEADGGNHDIYNPVICHWCKKKGYGVQIEAIEVYVQNGKNVKKELVHVHRECQEIREKQLASIPFPETVSST